MHIVDTIDLHGLDGDEAIIQLDQFINQAVMNKINSVKIIHGKGSGILKKRVTDYLEKSGLVTRYETKNMFVCYGTMVAELIKI